MLMIYIVLFTIKEHLQLDIDKVSDWVYEIVKGTIL